MNNNHRITLNTNKNIMIEFTDERIIPASGLAVVGQFWERAILLKNSIVWMIPVLTSQTIFKQNVKVLPANQIQPTDFPNGLYLK